MPVDTWKLTDPLGVTLEAVMHDRQAPSILSTLDGMYGGLGVKGEKIDLIGDGTVPSDISRPGRQWTAGGRISIVSEQEVLDTARRISGLFGGADNDSLGLMEVSQGGVLHTTQVQLDGEIKIDVNRDYGFMTWQLPLFAPDPHLYGSPRQTLLHPVGSGVGLRYPLFAPTRTPPVLDFGGATDSQALLINAGNATAYPTFQVEVDDGSGFRLSDGVSEVEYVGACSRSVPVLVDMRGSVTVSGMDRSVQLTRREWFGIPPHGSASVWLTTLQGGGGAATATIRDTWI